MNRRLAMRGVAALFAGAFVLAAAGCYESPNVTLTASQAGHYKGRTDPLVAKLKNPELQKNLRARLNEADSGR